MSKFSIFKPWTWFQSEERNQRDESPAPEINYTFGVTPPYKNVYFTGSSIVVVLQSGEVIMKNGVDDSIVKSIQGCSTEQQIRNLLTTVEIKEDKKESEVETKEERKIVTDNLAILRNNPDFWIKDNQIFLADVSLELPAVIAGSFIELLERMDIVNVEDPSDEQYEEYEELNNRYQALKMFWYWTALNPIDSARKDVFNFIRKNDINITSTGLLMMYRRVVGVEDSGVDKALVEFVSNNYLKVKRWKKATQKYNVYKDTSEVLQLLPKDKRANRKWKKVGNLANLYWELTNFQVEKVYTDNHTGTKNIQIGGIYKEDEDKIDLDNTKDCSRGLHVGSKSFGFDGFGNVGVLCLVNPMYVRSVPVSETNKMRVSEMFVAGEMELEEYSDTVESQEVLDFSEEYCNTTLVELQKSVKNRDYSNISCQNKEPQLPVQDLRQIIGHIKSRIQEVV